MLRMRKEKDRRKVTNEIKKSPYQSKKPYLWVSCYRREKYTLWLVNVVLIWGLCK